MRFTIILALLILAGCASDDDVSDPTLGALVRDRLPTGVWHSVVEDGRTFTAWRTGGEPETLWVIIDGQERAIAVACRDLFVDAVVETCELLAEKKSLPKPLAETIYIVALERLVGVYRPRTTPSEQVTEPQNLATTPHERGT